MTGILFLDIDGPLLPTRAWGLPANLAALARRRSGASHADVAPFIDLDPIGTALVRRICELSSARIVICSSWRYSASDEVVRLTIERHGLGDLLHRDPLPRLSPGHRIDKGREISAWIADHRATGRYATLDDDADRDRLPHGIPCDPDVGITTSDYRILLRAVGGVDPVGGVPPLDPADEARLLTAFDGDHVAVARWLHGRRGRVDRCDDLVPSRSRLAALRLEALGDEESVRRRLREGFWDELEAAVRRPDPGADVGDF